MVSFRKGTVQKETKVANWALASQWKISYSYRNGLSELQFCGFVLENWLSSRWAWSEDSQSCTVVIPEEVGQADSKAVHAPKDAGGGGRIATGKTGKKKKRSPKRQPCTTRFCTVSRTERVAQRSVDSLFVRWATSAPLQVWASLVSSARVLGHRSRCDALPHGLDWLGSAPSRCQSRAVPWLLDGQRSSHRASQRAGLCPNAWGVLLPFGNSWQLISIVRGLRLAAVGTMWTVPATA